MADSQRVTWMAFAILAMFDINIQNMLLLNALSTAQKETIVLEMIDGTFINNISQTKRAVNKWCEGSEPPPPHS